MEKIIKIFSSLIIISFLFMETGFSTEILEAGKFSNENPKEKKIPENFEPLVFEKIKEHSKYQLVKLDNKVVVKAVSDKSASGLIRKMDIDLNEYPIIEWQWRVENTYEKASVREKSGDDYPARIYIAFKYQPDMVGFLERVKFKTIKAFHGEFPPVAAINYIYESKEKVGTIVSNPYTDRVKMIVVDSGKDNLKKWKKYRRNILEDYKLAFGKTPPMVSGIAIMTDSDNTGESATAYYGDIIFKKENTKTCLPYQ